MIEQWDTGDMGCGRLVYELRKRLDGMRPGQRLEVVTHDLGAPTDLPAWCRMTGHTLVRAEHPIYVIERKAR